MNSYDLIEEFTLEVNLNDGSHNKLQGFYTINEDKLNQLPDENKLALFNNGSLTAIYMVIASLSNFRIILCQAELG